MDIEQITNETLDKVERLDRDLRGFMDSKSSGSSSGTGTFNQTKLTNDICDDIKGTSDIDLTTIYDKLNDVNNYLTENPIPKEFSEDPFKLDEPFTEYVPNGTVKNTSDSVECTKSYIINEFGNNNYGVLTLFAIYCEGETFSATVTVDAEVTADSIFDIYFPDSKIISTDKNYKRLSFKKGRHIMSETIEGVTVQENGNFMYVYLTNKNARVYSFKVEVFGKNIKILSKPTKYKCFTKFDETIISKVENYNGYCLKLKTDTMNPADLSKKYDLEAENVRDFQCILATFKPYSNIFLKGVYCYAGINIDCVPIDRISNQEFKVLTSTPSAYTSMIDNSSTNQFFYTFHTSFLNKEIWLRWSGNLAHTNVNTGSLTTEKLNSAYCANIYDNYNPMFKEDYRIIVTRKNLSNILYFKLTADATTFDLGKGTNVTAYYDKDSRDTIRVYMKNGDKMVRKTVNITHSTNDDGNAVESASIIEEKVIGTYDQYFETTNEKYLVVKDNVLYMFKH